MYDMVGEPNQGDTSNMAAWSDLGNELALVRTQPKCVTKQHFPENDSRSVSVLWIRRLDVELTFSFSKDMLIAL